MKTGEIYNDTVTTYVVTAPGYDRWGNKIVANLCILDDYDSDPTYVWKHDKDAHVFRDLDDIRTAMIHARASWDVEFVDPRSVIVSKYLTEMYKRVTHICDVKL